MKTNYTLLFMAIMLCSVMGSMAATRVVSVKGWDPASTEDPSLYYNSLYDAIEKDSTERKANNDVVYELDQNCIYYMGKIIKNYDFHLKLRGKVTDGLLPEIQVCAKADGTYGNDYIQAFNDVTLENIAFNAYTPDGGYLNWEFEIGKNRSVVRINNCTFDGDRNAPICAKADSLSIFITNCTMGNNGYRYSFGGNGRMIDLRPEAKTLDTLWIENTTTYNLTDRIIRNMATVINNLYIDHLTAVNTLGRHGGIQMGKTINGTIKNSLFSNVIMLGHTQAHTAEQTQPDKHFAVISLDTIYPEGSYVIENNNIYWDDEVEAIWASIDSVEAPNFVSALVEEAVDNDMKNKIYFTEKLKLKTFCSPQIAYVQEYYANPKASAYSDAWCVGSDGTGYFPDELDAAYSETSKSYTAAESGMPVGNLNYFPNAVPAGLKGLKSRNNSKAYPNPFSAAVNIQFELKSKDFVTVSVFDLNGREVKTLHSGTMNSGLNSVSWNRETNAGAVSEAGMYFYKIQSTSGVETGNLILVK